MDLIKETHACSECFILLFYYNLLTESFKENNICAFSRNIYFGIGSVQQVCLNDTYNPLLLFLSQQNGYLHCRQKY